MSEESQDHKARIEKLHQRITTGPMADRIRAAAIALAYRYQVDRDDIAQDIVLAILERAEGKPDFTGHTDAYLVQHGAWRAVDPLRTAMARPHAAIGLDDEEDRTTFDALSHNPWPVVEDRIVLTDALSRLPSPLQAAAAEILNGHTPDEAATHLQVSRRTFYYRRQDLIAALAEELRPHGR